MSAVWVAGSVRARAIARRAIGPAAARDLAASASLPEAIATLRRSAYGRETRTNTTLAESQHGVAATVLWHMRVLAGWLPADGVAALRALAGWFEIANVDQHLRALAGLPVEPPFRLGMLKTVWPKLAGTGSVAQVRDVLAASGWRDPGGDTVRDIQLGMRLAWADQVRMRVAAPAGWIPGAVALLVARERFALDRALPPESQAAAFRLLGPGHTAGHTIAEMARALPRPGAQALADVDTPADLWRAEVRWWARLRAEGTALLAGSGFDLRPVVGAVAVLAADAWLVRAALALAARGGDGEAFDALA